MCVPARVCVRVFRPARCVCARVCASGFDEEQNEPELTAPLGHVRERKKKKKKVHVMQANTAGLQQDGKTVIKP